MMLLRIAGFAFPVLTLTYAFESDSPWKTAAALGGGTPLNDRASVMAAQQVPEKRRKGKSGISRSGGLERKQNEFAEG